MLANVVTIEPTHATPLEDSLQLPPLPEDLLEAERVHAEATANLAAMRVDIARLRSLVETGERQAALATFDRQVVVLEAAEETAARVAREARRVFSDSASKDITPAADAVCEEAVGHIEAALDLVEKLDNIAREAGKAGLTIKHPQIGRAACIIRQLYAALGELAPKLSRRTRNAEGF